jgi:tryptophan-rich sensory protein
MSPMLVSFLGSGVTLAAGGALTRIGPWYFSLSVPPWKPPNWAFGPVWTAIGVCSALSAAYAWRAAGTAGERKLILALFGANAVFNVLWSLFFFRLRRPDWALIEVVPLWLSVLAPVLLLWPIRPLSSLLLLPYLLWVSIAATLNLSIVRRNAPFGPARVRVA